MDENFAEAMNECEEPVIVTEESATIVEQEVSEQPAPLYKVQVTHPSLRRRAAPSVDGDILGKITDEGEYYIYNQVKGWGQLNDGSWIMLSYTKQIS